MIGLLNPWVLLGMGAGALVLVGGSYIKGRSDANARCDIRVNTMIAEAQEAKEAEMARANEAATDLETEDAEAEIIYRTITRDVERIVERPVYLNRCLDDDGLSIARAALAGPAAFTAQPSPALPEP